MLTNLRPAAPHPSGQAPQLGQQKLGARAPGFLAFMPLGKRLCRRHQRLIIILLSAGSKSCWPRWPASGSQGFERRISSRFSKPRCCSRQGRARTSAPARTRRVAAGWPGSPLAGAGGGSYQRRKFCYQGSSSSWAISCSDWGPPSRSMGCSNPKAASIGPPSSSATSGTRVRPNRSGSLG